MKISWNNSTVVANRWRCGAILLASVSIVWVAFISSSAQLKQQKHVTSVEMGRAAEGARVTVISDSALNDYEAFRRGDRFYVKIPLSEFSFSQPRFHGNGFDDVEVQKVGDGVVVSFKLQLGASAHVEQHGNRLEVIFTAPNRGQYASVASNRSASSGPKDGRGNQGNQDRQRDAAGPVPSDAAQTSRQRYARVPRPETDDVQRHATRNVRTENNESRTNPVNNAPLPNPTPRSVNSPTPVSNYPAAPSYTPAVNTPVTNSKPAIVPANSPNSKLREWFLANGQLALLAALVLAGLIASVAVFLYRRRTTKPKATGAKPPLVQPKYDSETESDELTASPRERGRVVAAFSQQAIKSDWSRAASKPAFVPAPEVAANHAAAFPKSSNSSVAVADNESGNEEREVFEL